ncbi:MAG: CbiX/SirB N-terminal domain-containing protein, partial [Acidobacteriota bacterium]
GGIEKGIRQRLEGLSYTMGSQGLLPDERLADWVIVAARGTQTTAQSPSDALLVVAHGARRAGWNDRVVRMMDRVDWPSPKGVAFLTTSSPEQSLANVAARLDQPGVNRIIVVPLFVSSFSDHYEEIRYYAGERTEAPAHVHGEPLKTRAKLILTGGMDDDALLARILADQARSISTDPNGESLVLVAHGPNGDSDNERWLACLKAHATYLQQSVGFRRVWFITLRDDSPKAVRDAATAALREKVRADSMDTKVLVVPVLVSLGRVQSEIKKRLEGLAFRMSASGIADHPLAAEWIRQQGARAGPRVTQPATKR